MAEHPNFVHFNNELESLSNQPLQQTLNLLHHTVPIVANEYDLDGYVRGGYQIPEDGTGSEAWVGVQACLMPRQANGDFDGTLKRYAIIKFTGLRKGILVMDDYELWWKSDRNLEQGMYFELRGSQDYCTEDDAQWLLGCLSPNQNSGGIAA